MSSKYHKDLLKTLLMELQYNFPLSRRPFKDVGSKLKLTENEVIKLIRRLVNESIIRRISLNLEPMILDNRARALIGLRVKDAYIRDVGKMVNNIEGVKHNYLRDDRRFNLWFTLKLNSFEEINSVVGKIVSTGLVEDYIILPTKRIYKLDVRYDLYKGISWGPPVASKPDKSMLKKVNLNKDILMELSKGIKVVEDPFKELSSKYGFNIDTFLEELYKLFKYRLGRFFGATLDSYGIGFRENAMILISVDEDSVPNLFNKLIRDIPEATHCIERLPPNEAWRYRGYIMLHSRERSLITPIIDRLNHYNEVEEVSILYSIMDLRRL